ncbi:hypothetical protein V5E97_06690 [Singulisphaera sp. Ch08]|uniref:Uncharacterized protein n=1 Tax=Singulisphaera sp. Ch08 TaxID=3120278 RepID=A0AAU7CKZ9_9BACT
MLDDCVSDGTFTMTVNYGVTPCVLVSGLRYWRMVLTFPTMACRPSGTYYEIRHGDPTKPTVGIRILTVNIPFTCDYSLLSFTFPTSLDLHGTPQDPSGLGTPLPVPGGGGAIGVTP